jgi:chemotaxis protein CheX
MKVEYIAPFAEAAVGVFEALIGMTPERGQLKVSPSMNTMQQINVVCGLTGQLEGIVVYGMSMITADKIASKMLGQPVITFDALAASAIAELGNMVSGHSSARLASLGYECDITPPTIIRGLNVSISTTDIPTIQIPLELPDLGVFELSVSLRHRVSLAAA